MRPPGPRASTPGKYRLTLGWRLVRVWSADWWIDRKNALDRLDAALAGELQAFRTRVAAETESAGMAGRDRPALIDTSPL
jgi:hypothetical protein